MSSTPLAETEEDVFDLTDAVPETERLDSSLQKAKAQLSIKTRRHRPSRSRLRDSLSSTEGEDSLDGKSYSGLLSGSCSPLHVSLLCPSPFSDLHPSSSPARKDRAFTFETAESEKKEQRRRSACLLNPSSPTHLLKGNHLQQRQEDHAHIGHRDHLQQHLEDSSQLGDHLNLHHKEKSHLQHRDHPQLCQQDHTDLHQGDHLPLHQEDRTHLRQRDHTHLRQGDLIHLHQRDYTDHHQKDQTHLHQRDHQKKDKTHVREKDHHQKDQTYLHKRDHLQKDETHVREKDHHQKDQTYLHKRDHLQKDQTHVREKDHLQKDQTHLHQRDHQKKDKTHVREKDHHQKDQTYLHQRDHHQKDKTHVREKDHHQKDQTYLHQRDHLQKDQTHVREKDQVQLLEENHSPLRQREYSQSEDDSRDIGSDEPSSPTVLLDKKTRRRFLDLGVTLRRTYGKVRRERANRHAAETREPDGAGSRSSRSSGPPFVAFSWLSERIRGSISPKNSSQSPSKSLSEDEELKNDSRSSRNESSQPYQSLSDHSDEGRDELRVVKKKTILPFSSGGRDRTEKQNGVQRDKKDNGQDGDGQKLLTSQSQCKSFD
ncbi:semenogelin-1 [Pangasianodon hypophthalmus]|uniref:semenogelin-1 n=1 Tax=Pangasianodon hypophthalmus TaxID=310915 RepID=UPI002306DE7D|nr:semenogelin-1 [Pangasianodon hypophthalmus]